jgi:CRISPR-associated protein Cas1
MSLHALAYCERLFYLEEVEEIRVADDAVFAGRRLHEELANEDEEKGQWSNLEMACETLGLVGKVDCLKRRDGTYIPYEHKRGRAYREGKRASAWPSDKIQISAYAMLLEVKTGEPVPEGRVRYHSDNVTVRVPLDENARNAVLDAIARARQLGRSTVRPPVASNDRLCIRCSLAPVCLPEEERLAANPQWEPIRLFPQNRELMTLHVQKPGAKIGRSGDTLKVETPDGENRIYPIRKIGAVVIHGYPQITTQALHLCARQQIPVHWISPGQKYLASMAPGAGAVQRRLRQYKSLSSEEFCFGLAKQLVVAKIHTALRYVLRQTQSQDRKALGVGASIGIMRAGLKQAVHCDNPDELRGHEGIAGKAYFSAIGALLRPEIPKSMRWTGRSRRPPQDCFNALLGFGYSLLYQAVWQAVVAVGLEPALGFYHTPRSSAYPLVLDLMELFRIPVWDIVLVGSINRLQWDPARDFEETPGRVWLSEYGRKKAIGLFEQRLEETWKHPVVGYSLSYARLMELEVRLLEKEWSGGPGLFARMRLR